MRQLVLCHKVLIPFEIRAVRRILEHDKIACSLKFLYHSCNLSVPLFVILETETLARSTANAEYLSALPCHFDQLAEGFRRNALHFRKEDDSVLLRSVAELALPYLTVVEYDVGHVVRSTSALVHCLPDKGSIWHVELYRERLGLHAHLGPHIVVCRKNADIRVHIDILKHAAHPRAVVVQQPEIRPPGIVLVIEASVLHPARIRSVLRGVVESVPDGMGNSGKRSHITAVLEKFQRSCKDLVGVGHFLGADEALALQVRGGRYVLVNHRVAAATAVVFVPHLLAYAVAQPVGGPGLTFRDVQQQGGFEQEESAAVALHTRFDAVVTAPLGINGSESLVQQFCLGEFEVETDPLHLLCKFTLLLCTVVKVEHVTQAADLEHRERQPRGKVITAATVEFFRKIACPVGAFELHTVNEKRPQVLAERTEFGLDGAVHMVEVLAYSLGIHMVKYGAGSTRSTIDHAGEGLVAHHCIELPFAFGRDFDADYIVHEPVGHVDGLIEAADRVRDKERLNEMRNAAGVGHGDSRIQFLENVEFGHFEEFS